MSFFSFLHSSCEDIEKWFMVCSCKRHFAKGCLNYGTENVKGLLKWVLKQQRYLYEEIVHDFYSL